MSLPSIEVAAGRVEVLHRLALAVELVDGVTRGPVWRGPAVGRETARSVAAARRPPRRGRARPDPAIPFDRRSDSCFLLRHESPVTGSFVIRVVDRTRTWVPRRFLLPLWTLAEVSAADRVPPAGPFVPATARSLRPWLLPGFGYPLARGTTGLSARIVVAGQPARWARVEVFTTAGRVGWGHADEHGQVLVVLTEQAAYPVLGTQGFQVAVRVHVRDPAAASPVEPHDPLADLPVEPVARSSNPPLPSDLDNDLLRGTRRPPAYATAPDQVRSLAVGTLSHLGDIAVSP